MRNEPSFYIKIEDVYHKEAKVVAYNSVRLGNGTLVACGGDCVVEELDLFCTYKPKENK